MAIRITAALRNFLLRDGAFKNAFQNGIIKVFTGSQPATAEAAETGTLLLKFTKASGAHTNEVLATGTLTVTGSLPGTFTSVTVNSVELLSGTVTGVTDLATTAAAIAQNINDNINVPEYTASSSGAVVTIKAAPGSGTTPNGWTVAATTTGTLTYSKTDMTGGVAAANGLIWGPVSAGKIVKGSDVWSGVGLANGTAGWFRALPATSDPGTLDSSELYMRLDGNISTSGANSNWTSTSVVIGATVTADEFKITLPASG